MSLLQNSNAIETGGYTITKSLRFRRSASAYLNRTPASAGNRQKFTWSAWVKRGQLSSGAVYEMLFTAGTNDASDRTLLMFDGGATGTDNLTFWWNQSSGVAYGSYTTAVFRDPSAWYHIVVSVDTTLATAVDRVKIYVNGTQQTGGAYANGYIPQNTNLSINNTVGHSIGGNPPYSPKDYFDGYMAEVNFIDGQALTPSSFGQTDVLTGVWTAKKYTGTYGTNGFYLPLTNTSTTSTLVADSSGNGNNWTPNNISLTAGTTYDSMLDSPTMSMTSTTTPVGNYAVMNPVRYTNSVFSYANANLQTTSTSGGQNQSALTTIGVSSGKWYAEFIPTTQPITNGSNIGVTEDTTSLSYIGAIANAVGYEPNGQKLTNNSFTAYGATYAVNDVIGVALDMDAGTCEFYKNGVSQGVAKTGLTGTQYMGVADHGGTSSFVWSVNFGQRPFSYTPPTGYKALCTTNLPDSTIVKGNKYMDATLFTGNGSTQSVVNAAGFSPDIVWNKTRSISGNHIMYDVVRGAGNYLHQNLTNAEAYSANTLISFNSNGFTVGSTDVVNSNSGATGVAWQWDAGSSTVTNTSGSISSQVRASTTAGVSVVTYTGTGANATVGHGLGVAPKMIIVKVRSTTNDWPVYHANLTSAAYRLQLNTTIAQANAPTAWNSTAPTSSVFSIGTLTETNASSQTFVAYCFAEIAGFSKFGSYTGNGSADGPFVYLGFRPKYVMIKRTDSTENWQIVDAARDPYNVTTATLFPNLSNAESTGVQFDFLSNGFKLKSTTGGGNASGGTYIYMAFAETPFRYALGR